MQKGMNQTVAWLLAIFSASALFSLGAFMISKYQPSHAVEEQHLSAKTVQPEHKKHVGKKESPEKGGETLRPDDMSHTAPHH